ncbi:YdeI/OmpD-associated family protein [Terrimonas pollutisoli]|uniref:YdeI/OmpD-associated family protein n=1 Tax=Terrimonas pollutisoli TaxID=3034147 RepID=UPI0023EB5BCD|nr:YdeI/OmpD-associated family protein [Terrimonas sp. H1YJ31]
MVQFTATIHKFEKQGEKSGWTYIEIPADIAQQLKPGNKKSFRVKGKLDQFKIAGVSLLPMGGGSFIMAINATMRKGIGKKQGAMLKVALQEDKKAYELNAEFLECLNDEPRALKNFEAMPRSFQNYYSKWIESAKTEPTKTKRIAAAVSSLATGMNFSEMMRSMQKKNM